MIDIKNNSQKYRLQKYEDDTYGYLGIDGDEKQNFTTKSPVICTQRESEHRLCFLDKNGFTFNLNQYGSDEELDRLVNSSWLPDKRKAAKLGYGLEKLINCSNFEIRRLIANKGYGLDKLIGDRREAVRAAVVHQKYRLDILINDISSLVRGEVALQGYGLDILIHDEDEIVREYVQFYLNKNHLTLEEWIKRNGK